jgi:hypothetical protein
MFGVLLYLCIVFLVAINLDALTLDILQDLQEQDFELFEEQGK